MELIHGFLLTLIRFGDYDAVLHTYTQKLGFQSFFVKGIYRPKNKKKAYLQPLNELNFTLSTKNQKGDLKQVIEIELLKNIEIQNDFKAQSIVFFMADILHQILNNELENKQIYSEILLLLQEIENGNYSAHYIFLIKILMELGISPLLQNGHFLHPEKGIFDQMQNHQIFDKVISSIWKQIIHEKYPYCISINNNIKKKLMESIILYYHCHITNFKVPKSLEVIQEMYK